MTIRNASTMLLAADQYNASSLKEKCLQYIVHNFDRVSKVPEFEAMGRDNMELVFEILGAR